MVGAQAARPLGISRSVVPSLPGPVASQELFLRRTVTVSRRRRGFLLLLFSAPDVSPRSLLLVLPGASYRIPCVDAAGDRPVWTRSLDLLWSL